jgi:hypothetical protein
MTAPEYRLTVAPIDLTAPTPAATPGAVAGGTLRGYAALFDVEAEIAGLFLERIAPGAFRSALARPDDVRALFNHDPSLLLGRTANGTLRLTEDARGLRYEVTLPGTAAGQDVRELVSRGDVTQSSFGFTVREETWIAPAGPGGLPTRVITAIGVLYDVSPVTYPAYASTSVGLARGAAAPAAATRTEPARRARLAAAELAQRRDRLAAAERDQGGRRAARREGGQRWV